MPAYFWIHNLYALERNSWKAKNRDKRKVKIQRIETDYLAPDTAEEIITALSLLGGLLGEAGFSPMDMAGEDEITVRQIHCRHFEHSKRDQVIIKPLEAIAAYRQMLRYYAVKTIAAFLDSRSDLDFNGLCKLIAPQERIKDWVNVGGQIVPAFRVDNLRKEIGDGKYKNWDEIHHVYDLWDEEYPLDKCRHAWAVLEFLHGTNKVLDAETFKKELTTILDIHHWIEKQIYESRAKDYRNHFKKATFRNKAEMEQVLGKLEDNSFIRLVKKEGVGFKEMIERVSARL
jgi:hypothetical protein